MSHGRDEVKFTNFYGKKLFVAYMRRNWDCLADSGEPWQVRGWINLDPGETETRANATENQWFYYYAEATDGAFWAGPHVVEVTHTAFHTCTGVSHIPDWRDVGMRVLDTVKYSGVVFL